MANQIISENTQIPIMSGFREILLLRRGPMAHIPGVLTKKYFLAILVQREIS